MTAFHCFVSFSLLLLAGNTKILGIWDHYGKVMCLFACSIKHLWRLQGSFFSWWGLEWPRTWRLVHRLVTSSTWGPFKLGTYCVQTHLSFVGIWGTWQNSMPSLVSGSEEPYSDSWEVVLFSHSSSEQPTVSSTQLCVNHSLVFPLMVIICYPSSSGFQRKLASSTT